MYKYAHKTKDHVEYYYIDIPKILSMHIYPAGYYVDEYQMYQLEITFTKPLDSLRLNFETLTEAEAVADIFNDKLSGVSVDTIDYLDDSTHSFTEV